MGQINKVTLVVLLSSLLAISGCQELVVIGFGNGFAGGRPRGGSGVMAFPSLARPVNFS